MSRRLEPIYTERRLTLIQCGPDPKPKEHECDCKGAWVDVQSSFGAIQSSTCSVCGRPAFNEWEIW